MAPKSNVTRDQPISSQMRRQRARAGRVMGGVEQDLHPANHETLQPRRPPRIRQTLTHRLVGNDQALTGELVQERNRDGGVVALMLPA